MTKTVAIGRFGKTFGVHGWLRIQSFTSPKEKIFEYQPWYIANNTEEILHVTEHQRHGEVLLVHIAGYDTPENIKLKLTGKTIIIKREQLPKLNTDDYYWADLEGLAVVTLKGESLGYVDHLIETGANDILVVKNDRERLIPFIRDQVIMNVDLGKKIIEVDWELDF